MKATKVRDASGSNDETESNIDAKSNPYDE
jgi:hypothetical protein